MTNVICKLQRRQTEQRENDSHDHEARDHLRLAPAAQLEVVMQRRHAEDALPAGRLEVADLQHDRGGFEQEHAADQHQQQLLLDQDRDDAERGAQRQRSDVAHEDLGGIGVVPKESERGAHQRSAEHRQLGGLRKADQQQVLGKDAVAGDVGQRGVGRGRDREDADREAVEAVGQVHGIRFGDQHEHREREVADAEVRNQVLEEREDEPGVVEAVALQDQQRDADRHADEDLKPHLVARQQPMVRAADDLQVVIGEADRAVSGGGQHRNPDVGVREIRPQQRRHQRRRQNQQAAHGRRARFRPMGLRAVGANHLADLELAQLPDQPRPEHQADRQRRQRRRRGAERDVARHVEHRELRMERIEQVIQHQRRSAFSRSTTRSVLTPRDPLTRIRSPALTSAAAASAASSLVAK